MQRGRPRHDDILTPREWEVLDLIREGLTNEQIAERLDVSFATARFHVSEIISKLGVETRQDAAAWAGRPRHRGSLGLFLHSSSIRTEFATVARVLGGAIVVAALLVLVLLAVGAAVDLHTRSELSTASVTPEAVVETTVITYWPVGTPTRRETGGVCSSASVVLTREGVWRCEPPLAPAVDPCFGPPGALEVVCPLRPEPNLPDAYVLELDELPLALTPVPAQLANQAAQAWWIQTADGSMCGFQPYGTAPVVNGQRMNFWCDNDTALLGLPTPGKVWTARRVPFPRDYVPVAPGTVVPETMVELRTIWR